MVKVALVFNETRFNSDEVMAFVNAYYAEMKRRGVHTTRSGWAGNSITVELAYHASRQDGQQTVRIWENDYKALPPGESYPSNFRICFPRVDKMWESGIEALAAESEERPEVPDSFYYSLSRRLHNMMALTLPYGAGATAIGSAREDFWQVLLRETKFPKIHIDPEGGKESKKAAAQLKRQSNFRIRQMKVEQHIAGDLRALEYTLGQLKGWFGDYEAIISNMEKHNLASGEMAENLLRWKEQLHDILRNHEE